MNLVRGRVYSAVVSENVGEKLYLVVSNNQRNRALHTALVVRLTTSPKPPLASIVQLPNDEQFAGSRVLCDDIEDLYEQEVREDAGGLSPRAMAMVDTALKSALDLT